MASELALTGRIIKGEEARQVGLVSQCFADEGALLQHAQKTAELIASKSPLAVVGTKRILVHARWVFRAAISIALLNKLVSVWLYVLLLAKNLLATVVGAMPTLSCYILQWSVHKRVFWNDKQVHVRTCLMCCRDHSVPDGLDYVAAYNAAMLPSADIQEVFNAVVKQRRAPQFSKL